MCGLGEAVAEAPRSGGWRCVKVKMFERSCTLAQLQRRILFFNHYEQALFTYTTSLLPQSSGMGGPDRSTDRSGDSTDGSQALPRGFTTNRNAITYAQCAGGCTLRE